MNTSVKLIKLTFLALKAKLVKITGENLATAKNAES